MDYDNDRIKDEAKENFKNTEYALKLYNKIHQDDLKLREPQLSDFYQPSAQQRLADNKKLSRKAFENLLFSKRILEGIARREKIISRSWSV